MSERITSRGNPDSVRRFLGLVGFGATAAALATGLLFKPYLMSDTCPPSTTTGQRQEFLDQKPTVVAGFMDVSMALGATAGAAAARRNEQEQSDRAVMAAEVVLPAIPAENTPAGLRLAG